MSSFQDLGVFVHNPEAEVLRSYAHPALNDKTKRVFKKNNLVNFEFRFMRQAKRINPQATCFLQYDKLLVDNRSYQYCTFSNMLPTVRQALSSQQVRSILYIWQHASYGTTSF